MFNYIINTIILINNMLWISFIFIKYKIGIISYIDMIKEVCTNLSKINIIYAKMLQWDIFKNILPSNNEIQDYFTWFNSNVPYTEKDINYEILNNLNLYVKNTNQTLVFENNFRPINSGTVALVFKAKLNEKPVAIKILRKNINKQIEEGIKSITAIIKVFSFFISLFYNINSSSLINVINMNIKILLEQTNLEIEILNNEKFQAISKSYDIIIPNVYKEFNLISNEIIIMDFLDGISPSINEDRFLKHSKGLSKFMIESYLIHKFIHSDLHTGNIICLENGIGIIDFGLVITITEKEAEYISDFIFSIKNKNFKRLVKSLAKIVFGDDIIMNKKFTELCFISNKLAPLRDNFKTFNSKLILETLEIFKFIQINNNHKGVKLLLSLVSCFSIIDICNEKNLPLIDHLDEVLFKLY
jgi:predicted unusual protein kinase regulating ubiquinone biosynthesis (AarF/ABC1/UbiB family)